jgi:hypothetical protein
MKKDNIIIIVIIIIAGIVSFLTYITMHPIFAFKLAIRIAVNKYGKAIAVNCEKIFRLETGNFKSGQWLGTFSPGMQNTTNVYPYGWTSLKPFWDSHQEYKPIGLKVYTENGTGKKVSFIQFPNVEGAVMTVCEFLKAHNNNGARWFSLDEGEQASYQAKLNGIKATLTDGVS